MPTQECLCGQDGIDRKCVHIGDNKSNPVPDPHCDCYACDKARGGPEVVHVSAFEKKQRLTGL